MGRRPLTDRSPRTRAGGEWTEAAFWGFIRSGLRQMSRRWPPRAQALKRASRPYVGPNPRQKVEVQCALCGQWFMRKEVQADHIVPCGELSSWDHVRAFMERLLIEVEGFQVACFTCHPKRRTKKPSAQDKLEF